MLLVGSAEIIYEMPLLLLINHPLDIVNHDFMEKKLVKAAINLQNMLVTRKSNSTAEGPI